MLCYNWPERCAVGFLHSRWWPILLGIFLVLTLTDAIRHGDSGSWLSAAAFALVLALALARQGWRNR